MNTYTLYWRDGKRDVIKGNDIADAMTHAGYGGGAIRALDFYAHGDNIEYEWNPKSREWDRTTPYVFDIED